MPASGILYGHPVSQPCRSVQWYLDYSGNTTVERKVVDILAGAQKQPDYVAKFPNHQVPGFETEDGFCFAESSAILKHVSRDDKKIKPQTAKDEARLNEYFGRHYSQVRKFSTEVFFHHLLTKDEEKKQAGLVAIKPQLEAYNEKLGKQKYILGDNLTLADFLFAPEVDQMEVVGKDILAPYQNILKYLERLTSDVKGYKECIGGMRSALGLNKTAPVIKLVYFELPGRAEPARLAFALGGVAFEDKRVSGEEWGMKIKPTVGPKQLPLLEVDGEVIGQSNAIMRYAGAVSSLGGKQLYPKEAGEALKVDEFCDIVGEVFGPLGKTFAIEDETERNTTRTALVAEGGDIAKWLVFIDSLLAKSSSSGFAVGDSLTMADICIFTGLQPLKCGLIDGFPKDCLDNYSHIKKHAQMIANIPQVKAYYKDATGIHAVYRA